MSTAPPCFPSACAAVPLNACVLLHRCSQGCALLHRLVRARCALGCCSMGSASPGSASGRVADSGQHVRFIEPVQHQGALPESQPLPRLPAACGGTASGLPRRLSLRSSCGLRRIGTSSASSAWACRVGGAAAWRGTGRAGPARAAPVARTAAPGCLLRSMRFMRCKLYPSPPARPAAWCTCCVVRLFGALQLLPAWA